MKIIFLNLTASRIWPDIEKERGIGASDAFIMHVTKHVAAMGHEVKLFANTPYMGNVDGVQWENYIEPDHLEDCDILLINRGFVDLDKFNAKKIIYWSHDNTDAPIMKDINQSLHIPDAIVAVSTFHKNKLISIGADPKKIRVIGNGLALPQKQFKDRELAVGYFSVPFKGLHILAKVWPEFSKDLPFVKLHICSGMGLYNMEGHDLYYSKVYDGLKTDPSVIYHGVLTNEEVRKVMSKCELMIYPNSFPETFCVAAYESISVGTPVISSDLGALPETVGDCGILIPGDATKTEYKEKMRKILMHLLIEHPEELQKLREKCYNRKLRSWEDVAKDLINLAEDLRNVENP